MLNALKIVHHVEIKVSAQNAQLDISCQQMLINVIYHVNSNVLHVTKVILKSVLNALKE